MLPIIRSAARGHLRPLQRRERVNFVSAKTLEKVVVTEERCQIRFSLMQRWKRKRSSNHTCCFGCPQSNAIGLSWRWRSWAIYCAVNFTVPSTSFVSMPVNFVPVNFVSSSCDWGMMSDSFYLIEGLKKWRGQWITSIALFVPEPTCRAWLDRSFAAQPLSTYPVNVMVVSYCAIVVCGCGYIWGR